MHSFVVVDVPLLFILLRRALFSAESFSHNAVERFTDAFNLATLVDNDIRVLETEVEVNSYLSRLIGEALCKFGVL